MPPVATFKPHARDQTFAEILQAEIDAQGISNRELARRLVKDPEKMNGARRQVIRWLNGETPNPTRPTRIRIAKALRIEPERLLRVRPLSDLVAERLTELEQRLGTIELAFAALSVELRELLDGVRAPRDVPEHSGRRG